jgi:hypothetical protein
VVGFPSFGKKKRTGNRICKVQDIDGGKMILRRVTRTCQSWRGDRCCNGKPASYISGILRGMGDQPRRQDVFSYGDDIGPTSFYHECASMRWYYWSI